MIIKETKLSCRCYVLKTGSNVGVTSHCGAFVHSLL